MKKKVLGIIVSLTVLVISIFIFKDLKNNKAKEVIKTSSSNIVVESEVPVVLIQKKEVEIKINHELPNVDTYFENYQNQNIDSIKYYLNDKEIDSKSLVTEAHEYTVKIIIDGEEYYSILKVVDYEKPKLELNEVKITEGEKYTINSFIKKCTDNSKSNCKLGYLKKDMANYTKPGTYNITIIASDNSGNKVEKTTKLVINAIKSNKSTTRSNITSNKTANSTNKSNITSNKSKYKTTFELKSEATELVSKNTKEANEILAITNKYRKEKNVGQLKLDKNLSIAANIRALEIAIYDKFSHTRPNGNFYSSVLKELNINAPYSGENIAYGYIDSEEVCEAWKNSKGHYENIINYHYTKLGVGVYNYNGRIYWVQIFSS